MYCYKSAQFGTSPRRPKSAENVNLAKGARDRRLHPRYAVNDGSLPASIAVFAIQFAFMVEIFTIAAIQKT